MLTSRQLSVFLKADQAKAAPSEITAQEGTEAIKRTETAIKNSERTAQEGTEAIKRTETTVKNTQAEIVQQGNTLSRFTLVTTAFLALSFCTSVFYLLLVI